MLNVDLVGMSERANGSCVVFAWCAVRRGALQDGRNEDSSCDEGNGGRNVKVSPFARLVFATIHLVCEYVKFHKQQLASNDVEDIRTRCPTLFEEKRPYPKNPVFCENLLPLPLISICLF
jgi:hypothetical protein